jgi:hypothetical protein
VTILAKLYTDEDISALVATLLRSRGLDIVTVPELATLGKTDSEQLEFAVSLDRCILTHNHVDFERLHFQYIEMERQHSGIIVMPQKNAYPKVGNLSQISLSPSRNIPKA